MQIHAYRRKDPIQVDLGKTKIDFKPNAAGDVVAEVEADAHCERLLEIDEAYREYKPVAEEKAARTSTSKAASPTPAPAAKKDAAEPVKEPAAGGEASGAGGTEDGKDPATDKPFLLKGETPEEDIDLGPMSLAELKAFAKVNEIKHAKTITEDDLRKQLFDAFQPGE